MERLICVLGLLVFVGTAWLVSSDRRRFPMRIVVGGLGLQLALAFLVLRTAWGQKFFKSVGNAFTLVLDSVTAGTSLMFSSGDPRVGDSLLGMFAFKALPTIIFFSALMSILYHLKVMHWIVRVMAWVMQFTLKTSGPETLAAAANVFVGHTEAPLVVRPFLAKMTRSELNAMMTGGFATVTGGLFGVYAEMGVEISHLLTASVISAPAALLIAKVMEPETDRAQVSSSLSVETPTETPMETASEAAADGDDSGHVNVIAAAVAGAGDGLKLALNVGAMLIAFLAILNLIDVLLGLGCRQFSWLDAEGVPQVSMGIILGYACWPIAWLLSIPVSECAEAGRLIGLKTVANEFIAYQSLGEMMATDTPGISKRTATILTYALAGFSNFGAIGIQIGGIGGLEPSRKKDLAQLGLRAMFGGFLACCMTGAIAGLLL